MSLSLGLSKGSLIFGSFVQVLDIVVTTKDEEAGPLNLNIAGRKDISSSWVWEEAVDVSRKASTFRQEPESDLERFWFGLRLAAPKGCGWLRTRLFFFMNDYRLGGFGRDLFSSFFSLSLKQLTTNLELFRIVGLRVVTELKCCHPLSDWDGGWRLPGNSSRIIVRRSFPKDSSNLFLKIHNTK
jgi:hypothetical protein